MENFLLGLLTGFIIGITTLIGLAMWFTKKND